MVPFTLTTMTSTLLLLSLAVVVVDAMNVIIIQPDDLPYFDQWTPPAHFPRNGLSMNVPSSGLHNIEWLRNNGLEMTQAYAASSMCGTSRYSTMTGRYPSRSSYGRWQNGGQDERWVSIPNTKLQDMYNLVDGQDCSGGNMASVFADHGYNTGFMGKWHLTDTQTHYSYDAVKNQIHTCGFTHAEAIYAENLWQGVTNNRFGHNMEYVTSRAISFIEDSYHTNRNFFMYFNPTVPHFAMDVYDSLMNYDCTQTPEGTIQPPNNVPGMTDGNQDCWQYRQSVLDRSGGNYHNDVLGTILVDDSVGALITTLEDLGMLDDTFILFQMDHGLEGKTTIYEQGIRIVQYIHYSAMIPTGARIQFDGIVSTIDVAPTLFDYANIDSTYRMDGMSWRDAVHYTGLRDQWVENRCLAYEMFGDRGIRCGCKKYMRLDRNSHSFNPSQRYGVAYDTEVLFDLCDTNGNYLTYPNRSPERTDLKNRPMEAQTLSTLRDMMDCFLSVTNPNYDPDYFTQCFYTWDAREVLPTPVPAVAPTPVPAALPTPVPVFAPTPAPVTVVQNQPVVDDTADCEDGTWWFTEYGATETTHRNCEWVREDVTTRCNPYHAYFCPASCGACPPN